MTELSPEQIEAAKQIAQESFEELIAGKSKEHEVALAAAHDQGFAKGLEQQSLAPDWAPGSQYNQDVGYASYEAEAQAKVTELRMKGVRGNLSQHADVLAIKSRHNR